MNKIIVIFMACLAFNASADQVYKCTDNSGAISYQSLPCQENSSATQRIEVDNTPDPDYVPETYPSITEGSESESRENEVKKARQARDEQLKQSRLALCEQAKKKSRSTRNDKRFVSYELTRQSIHEAD